MLPLVVGSFLLALSVIMMGQCADVPDDDNSGGQYYNDSSIMTISPMSDMSSYDLQCLSELPLEQLLKIHKSLNIVTGMVNEDNHQDIAEVRLDDRTGKGPQRLGNDGYFFDTSGNNETISAQPFIFDKIKYTVLIIWINLK